MASRIEDINDPKQAKRISNRMSKKRSNMKKKLYLKRLEEKVVNLTTQAAILSAQVTFLQTNKNLLQFEIMCLKLRACLAKKENEVQDALIKELESTIIKLKSRNGNSTYAMEVALTSEKFCPSSLFTEGTNYCS